VAPTISFISLYDRELVAAMANLAADLQATAPAVTPSGKASYLRAIAFVGNETVYGQSVRNPSNRANTYFSPGQLANVGAGGLLSANCENTHNIPNLPDIFPQVRCAQQPQFPWGHGVLTSYFPHLKAAKK
jgi:hypothetical protein